MPPAPWRRWPATSAASRSGADAPGGGPFRPRRARSRPTLASSSGADTAPRRCNDSWRACLICTEPAVTRIRPRPGALVWPSAARSGARGSVRAGPSRWIADWWRRCWQALATPLATAAIAPSYWWPGTVSAGAANWRRCAAKTWQRAVTAPAASWCAATRPIHSARGGSPGSRPRPWPPWPPG